MQPGITLRYGSSTHAMIKYLIVSAFPCEVFLLRLTFQYARSTLIYRR